MKYVLAFSVFAGMLTFLATPSIGGTPVTWLPNQSPTIDHEDVIEYGNSPFDPDHAYIGSGDEHNGGLPICWAGYPGNDGLFRYRTTNNPAFSIEYDPWSQTFLMRGSDPNEAPNFGGVISFVEDFAVRNNGEVRVPGNLQVGKITSVTGGDICIGNGC